MEEPYWRYGASADTGSFGMKRQRELSHFSTGQKSQASVGNQGASAKNRFTCHRCNQQGHYRSECPRLTCFACGQVGHVSRDCPARGGDCSEVGAVQPPCANPGYQQSRGHEQHLQVSPTMSGQCLRTDKQVASGPGQSSGQRSGTGRGQMTHGRVYDVPGFSQPSTSQQLEALVVRAGSIPRSSFPGYLSSEPSALTSHHLSLTPHPVAYGLDDITGTGMRTEPGLGGLTGASIRGYPPLQDPILFGQRPDVAVAIGSGIPDLINGRPESLAKVDAPPVPARESNILFVDGLPSDSSRREVGHLFRPFIGFKDIRVVHKEPRRSGDKAMVLCFVEFDDAKCALTALEALQGYKIDDKKPDSPVMRIHFAHFPFRLPSDCGEQWS